jgi:hypothetical protein
MTRFLDYFCIVCGLINNLGLGFDERTGCQEVIYSTNLRKAAGLCVYIYKEKERAQ